MFPRPKKQIIVKMKKSDRLVRGTPDMASLKLLSWKEIALVLGKRVFFWRWRHRVFRVPVARMDRRARAAFTKMPRGKRARPDVAEKDKLEGCNR